MDEQLYRTRRTKLLDEYFFLKHKRLYRSAAARVRQIAKLDLEYGNIPIEKTKRLFDYDNLIKKG